MLQLMRKKAQSWMIKVIFGVIIIVFVFFYGYRQKSDRGSVIAGPDHTSPYGSRRSIGRRSGSRRQLPDADGIPCRSDHSRSAREVPQ